jgi:recombination-promoting nuclease RpnB
MTNQPYNDLFLATFKVKSEVISYIKTFLPTELAQHIDLEALELDDTSYVTAGLDKYFSDVVYTTQWKGRQTLKITLLFEHKSWQPQHLSLQLLRYMLEIWTRSLGQQPQETQALPVVLPIVIYHGEERFLYKTLHQLFGEVDEVLLPFLPNFEYHVTNLSDFSDEQLNQLNLGLLYTMMLLFKHRRDWDFVESHATELFVYERLHYNDEVVEIFTKAVFHYLCGVHTKAAESIANLTFKLPPKIKDMAQTIVEQLIEKGEKLGLQKGEKLGIQKGKKLGEALLKKKTLAFVTNLLKKFPEWSDEQIAEIANVESVFVKKVRSEINNKHNPTA